MSVDEDEELTGTVYHPNSDYPMVFTSSNLGDGPGLATSDAEDSLDEGPSRPSTSFDRKGKAVDRPSSQWPGLGLEFDVPQRSSSVPHEEQLLTNAQDEEDFDILPPLKDPNFWGTLSWVTHKKDNPPPHPPIPRSLYIDSYLAAFGLPLQAPTGPSADPDSPGPSTPPGQIFRLGRNTMRLLDKAEAAVRDVRPFAATAAVAAEEITAEETKDAYTKLYLQLQDSEKSVADAMNYLWRVQSQVGVLAETFQQVPTIPISWPALNEMLEVYNCQEALYHEMWQCYAILKDEVKPLREELTTLQEEVSGLGSGEDGSGSASDVKQYVDLRLEKFTLELENVRTELRLESTQWLAEQLGDLWKHIKAATDSAAEHCETMLDALKTMRDGLKELTEGQAALRDLINATRLDGRLATDLGAVLQRVRDVELHVGLVEPDPSGTGVTPADPGPNPPLSRPASPHASQASSEPQDGSQGWRTAEFPAPSPPFFPMFAPLVDPMTEIQALQGWIDRVESTMEHRVQETVEAHLPGAVQEFLARAGLTPDILQELGEHVRTAIANRAAPNEAEQMHE
ncbi:hypothetical protein V8D89_016083 [Ganoderma adspersum]